MDAQYALIVASDRYDDVRLRQLRAPAMDADALAQVLGNPRIGGFEVSVVLDQMHGKTTRALTKFFRDRRPDDLLLLHLSCHGVKDEGGHLYFASTDTDVDDLDATAIASDWLKRQLDKCMSRRIVVMLDCCHSGAIGRGMLSRADAGVHTRERLEGRGRVLLTASDAVEYAFEGDQVEGEGKPSIFTSAVVDGLANGAADRDGDGWVSVDELYSHVHETVRDVTPHMNPRMWAFDVEGSLRIARNPHGPRRRGRTAQRRWRLVDTYSLTDSSDGPVVVAFRLDGRLLVAGERGRTARVWEAVTGRDIARQSHEDDVETVALSLDGRLLASASASAIVVSVTATGREQTSWRHHGVQLVAFSADGHLLATANLDQTARVWEAASGRKLARVVTDETPRALALSADATLLATGGHAGKVQLWDTSTGLEQANFVHKPMEATESSSPIDKFAQVQALQPRRDRGLLLRWGSLLLSVRRAPSCATFSRDARLLATGSYDGTVCVWELRAHREQMRFLHEGVRALAFSPDGRMLATGSLRDDVRVWDIPTGREVGQFTQEAAVSSIAFNHDGAVLATGDDHATTRVWTSAAAEAG